MKKRCFGSLVVGSMGVVGCLSTTSPEPQQEAAVVSRPVAAPTQSGTVAPVREVVRIEEPSQLTLPAALALTLEGNPELQSFSQTVRTGEARIIQAGLRPNPELSFSIEDAFGPYGNDSYSQATLQLSQVIELGGKRTARINAATAFHDQLKDDYEIKRVEVLSTLTDKFIRVVADQHLFELAEKAESLGKHALENVQKRVKAGGVSDLEEAKAKVLLARYQIASEHAEHELRSSKKALAAFWGEDTPKFSQISSKLFQDSELPSFEELSTRIERSPEIRKWATEKRLREAEKKLADAKAIPNIALGAGPRHLETTNDNSWVFQVAIPLNVFDRNQGARQEAEILSDKVSVDTTIARLRLENTLFALYQEAKHAQTELKVMKQEILPQAELALSTAQKGYDQGRFSYLDLMDAQRTLLEVHRENIEAAYSFHSFVNSIERLLGSPLNNSSKIN